MMEGDVIGSGHLIEVAVVRDNCANIEGQQPASPPKEQIVQAVAKPGHHDDRGQPPTQFNDPRAHGKRLCHGLELGTQRRHRHPLGGEFELHTHEKKTGCHIAKLCSLHDVGAALIKKA
jgi:hypothetical protein